MIHTWEWLFTGLAAGLIARLILKNSRLGLGADLALGGAGGLATGAMMRAIGITSPESGSLHIVVALIGAIGMIAAIHILVRTTRHAGRLIGAAMKPGDLESAVASLGANERRVLTKFLRREPVARDASAVDEDYATPGQRAADAIASFGGSWAFLGLFAFILFVWMAYNIHTAKPFDPYPFILLNLVLSCLAAVQAPVILMSQNRQAERDRLHARLDYEVNLKSEVEILALHEKIDELRERNWRDLLALQERQIELLEKLNGQQPSTDPR